MVISCTNNGACEVLKIIRKCDGLQLLKNVKTKSTPYIYMSVKVNLSNS